MDIFLNNNKAKKSVLFTLDLVLHKHRNFFMAFFRKHLIIFQGKGQQNEPIKMLIHL